MNSIKRFEIKGGSRLAKTRLFFLNLPGVRNDRED